MIFHHILSDLISGFGKEFFKSDFWHFLNKMLVPHSATRLAAPVTLTPHRVEYGVIHPLTPSSSPVTVLYCTVLYCTILYCPVLYCTVLYHTVLYCIVLHCTVLYCTVLYCTVLYCTVLYCTVLYCIILYCTVFRGPNDP